MTEAPGEFTINVHLTDGIGTLEWNGMVDVDTLQRAIEMATDDVIMGRGLRRVQVEVPAGDDIARRALHRAGFRREGVRREAMAVGDGHTDVMLYSRLASDIAYGHGSFSAVMNSVLPTKRALAHVLYRNQAGHLMLLSTHYKTDWELPGGVVEPDESPRTGAAREVAEELGVELPVGRLLCVDWLPRHLGWSDALQFVFDGGTLTDEQVASLHFADGEIVGVHWVELDDISGHMYDGGLRRLRTIVAAADADVPLYLEGGSLPA